MTNSVWLNSDGLAVKFGTTEGTAGTSGEVGEQAGNVRILEVRIPDLTVLTTTAVILDQNAYLGKSSRIEWVDVVNTYGATITGTGATLTVGLMKTDQTTLLSATGVLAAAPLTDWATAGTIKRYQVGVTGAGAYLGLPASDTAVCYLTAKYGTAAFTAGSISIRIGFTHP